MIKKTSKLHKINFLESSSTLIGTVIGAGILGLPFASSKVGFLPAVLILFVAGVVVVIINLMFVEVVLRTPHIHQLPGYAGIYLGHFAKKITLYSLLLASYGSLLAYTIGISQVLVDLFGGSDFLWALLFYIIGSFFVYKGLNIIKKAEFLMMVVIFSLIVLIAMFSFDKIDIKILVYIRWGEWIVPYGVMLFAYAGLVAIPQMRQQMTKGEERYISSSVIFSFIFIFVVYALFIFLVMGVTGQQTTAIATIGLGHKIGTLMLIIGNLLAFFTMSTSFLTIGLGIKEIFDFDYAWGKTKSWIMAVLFPALFYLIGARDFIKILSVAGGLLIGIQMIIIVLSFLKAREKGVRIPEFELRHVKVLSYILIIVLIIGIISTVRVFF